jgi:hypothetical protein
MFIGDSFTWGTGVQYPSTHAFPPLVGKFFNEESGDRAGRTVQTFNLGTPSYSPSIYGVVLRDFAPTLKPDIVVLALDDSDPQDDLVYSHLVKTDQHGLPLSVYPGLPGVPASLVPIAKHVKLVRHVSGLWNRYTKKVGRDTDLRRLGPNRYGHYRPGIRSEEQWREAFERSLALVDAFSLYCTDHRIKLAIINYPYAPAVTTHYTSTWTGDKFNFTPGLVLDPTFHRAVADFASARKIPYYDFTPYLRSLPEHTGIYNDKNGHYAERGYELLARELVRFLTPFVDDVAALDADKESRRRGSRYSRCWHLNDVIQQKSLRPIEHQKPDGSIKRHGWGPEAFLFGGICSTWVSFTAWPASVDWRATTSD